MISLGCVLVGLFLFHLLYPWNTHKVAMEGAGLKQRGGSVSFAWESIGSGALALRPTGGLGWVSRLSDEIIIIAWNSRPDIEPADAELLVALKNGKEQMTLSNGSILHLKESEEGRGLHPSRVETGLWIKPILLDNGAVLVEAARKLTAGDGKTAEEKGQFFLSPQGSPGRQPLTAQCVRELKTARSFSQDLLVQKYGDREYASWKDKAVLEISRGTGRYALFVSPGDYLLYEEGEWRIVLRDELKRDQPVAHIRAIAGKTLEIQVWDEVGFYPLEIKIGMEKQGRFQLKTEEMPKAIRLRSSTQFSCALGKRRVILRQGDWLLKTATGWRNLRRADEIKNYLQHRLKGELLIFDAMETEQGRTVLRGHMFDETRTQMQPLTLSVDAEKPQGKPSRRRKPFLSNGHHPAG